LSGCIPVTVRNYYRTSFHDYEVHKCGYASTVVSQDIYNMTTNFQVVLS